MFTKKHFCKSGKMGLLKWMQNPFPAPYITMHLHSKTVPDILISYNSYIKEASCAVHHPPPTPAVDVKTPKHINPPIRHYYNHKTTLQQFTNQQSI